MSLPICHTCGYRFSEGEQGWAEDWRVIDIETDSVRTETRYTCDGCEASA